MQISEKDIRSEQNRQEIKRQLAAELKNVMLEEKIQNVMTVYDKVSVEYDFMEKMEQ